MLTILLALTAAGGDGAPPRRCCAEPDSAGRAALHSALEAFSLAFREGNAEALDTMLTPDYVHTNGGGGTVLDRDRWLDFVRRRRDDLRRGRLRVDRYETSALSIRWYRGAAVVTSRVTTEGVQDQAPFASRLQVTQVWLRVGDRWRRAAFHDSPLATP